MAFEMKELRGSLFRNNKKEKNSQPDYNGSCKVNGVEYRLSAWLKETAQGEKFFSMALTHPDTLPKKDGQNGAPEPAKTLSAPDDDDDLPF